MTTATTTAATPVKIILHPDLDLYQTTVQGLIGAAALAAAQADARAKYPNESCGFVAKGQYVSCQNKAATPKTDFKIDDQAYKNAVISKTLTAVIHSHPGGPIFPSALDMQQQIASGVPWVILTVNSTSMGPAVAWGDTLPKPPIIGRPFVHGIFDCYSLIRDVFALGADSLKAQGISWPLPAIQLGDFPRDDSWWQGDEDLYVANMKSQGFTKTITRAEAQPGDAFLIALGNQRTNPKKKLCHAGVLLKGNTLLHHLPGTLSRREPSGIWGRAADMWVRHEAAS